MKVLVVVDMQYDFVDGALGTPEAQKIVPKVVEEIQKRASEDTVVLFTKDTHDDDYLDTLEGKNLPIPHCIKGTRGRAIVDEVFGAYIDVHAKYRDIFEVYPAGDDPLRIAKPSFGSIDFQNILYTMDEADTIEEITLMGLCTGICVMSNAILAKTTLPEVPVNVIADCCACVTPESHKTALEAMKLCQINII
jgi:nicotinamidase-related amidase